MRRARRPGQGALAHLRVLSRARLERHLGLLRDDVTRACHLSTMARHHPGLLAVGAFSIGAIAIWSLAAARRRTLPCAAAPAPAPAADGSWAVAIGGAVSAIYRLWAQSRQ